MVNNMDLKTSSERRQKAQPCFFNNLFSNIVLVEKLVPIFLQPQPTQSVNRFLWNIDENEKCFLFYFNWNF